MLDAIFKKLFGDKSQKDLKELLPIVDNLTDENVKILQILSLVMVYVRLHDN